MNMKCRYIDPEGVCTVMNRLCDDCADSLKHITYRHSYDVFLGVTTVKIMVRGKVYLSCEIYGQLEPCAIKEYAREMVELLIDKGVI